MLSEKAIALLARAFIQLLGKPASGSMAYVRCLPPDATRALAADPSFKVPGWQTAAVVETAEPEKRWIAADQAVEWREDKRDAALLLIDATAAGPGMDGIYSAAREIGERELFDVAHRLAHDTLPYGCKLFVKKALTKARQVGHQRHLAPWRVFTYLCRATHSLYAVGAALPEIGLWPVAMSDRPNEKDLDKAALLADKIFPTQGARLTPEQRVSALNLTDPEAERRLIQRLRATERLPRLEALADLARESDFWINNRLRPGLFEEQTLRAIHWVSWRGKPGKPLVWSGLSESNEPSGDRLNQRRLQLRLDPEGDHPQRRARLEVRWNVEPDTLAKGAVDYLVEVRTEQDVLAEKTVSHTGKSLQKAVFTQDDFENLDESDVFEPQVVIRALSEPSCETATESFILGFGQPDDQPVKSSAGRIYPTLALAAAHVVPQDHDLKALVQWLDDPGVFSRDKKGFMTCRWRHKVGRVYCPPLLSALAENWQERNGALGRWRVRVRADGVPVDKAEFIAAEVNPAAERLIQAIPEVGRVFEKTPRPTGHPVRRFGGSQPLRAGGP